MTTNFIIAKQLAAKKVITNTGEQVGALSDLVIDEVSGKIISVIVEVNTDSKIMQKYLQKVEADGKMLEIPYSAVRAVKDFIIIDERELLAAA